MYGQSTGEIMPLPWKPKRYPSRAEKQSWDDFVDLVDDANDMVVVCRLRGFVAAKSFYWGQKHGFNVSEPKALENRVLDAELQLERLAHLIRKVEDRTFTVQFRKGDIDIVDPSQSLEGWPLIVAGVLVVVGAVALAKHLWDELEDVERKYRILDGATDKAFCQEGSPQTCAAWKAYKVSSGLAETRKEAGSISSGLGDKLKTGAKWGLAIAIPLIVLAFVWRSQK